MNTDELETQWTVAARNVYAQRAEALIAEIRRHVEATLQRQGRQAEWQAYAESVQRLGSTANAFNDAEFDLCGSFPFSFAGVDERSDWDEGEATEDDEPKPVLSVLARWDYRITDPDTVITVGRAAYLTAWPGDTEEDARIRVPDVVRAAAEIMHAHGLASLAETAGLESDRDITTIVTHDGEADEAFHEDPFAIVRGENDA
ncbi:hypothetical protein [Dactylosporangium sp. NPDC050588]|uniref:hypothetical protein n=1 Tax=Dactylosporangium sp. NPDC050588 TaxID=3157211 RepID=UPI0033EA998A